VKKTLTRGVGILGSAAVAVVLFGSGSASAINEYAGLTYEQAASSGATLKIASRVGQYLPTAQCIVTGSRPANSLDSSGNNRGYTVLVDLNCNDPMTAGHGGYSVMSPQGKEAKALKDTGTDISNNYAQSVEAGQPSWCEENGDKCLDYCERSGTCSDEVLEFLGQ
jgi:hypothetical protein